MGEAVDLRHEPDEEGRDTAAVRIRVSRRQLRLEKYSQRPKGGRESRGRRTRRRAPTTGEIFSAPHGRKKKPRKPHRLAATADELARLPAGSHREEQTSHRW